MLMNFRSDIAGEVPYLRRFARALTGDAALADDLVQDCIERALRKQHLFDETRRLRAWLFAILRNLYISGLRRNAHGATAKSVDEMISGEDAVEPEQESRLALSDIASALERLPAAHREVLLLIALEEMSYREVAEIIGVPVGTVMSRLSRARGSLRAMLDDGDAANLRRIK
jgi:RNA polymerase sigma-70 factor (ECF subfamily)